jgi:hypothetical protein
MALRPGETPVARLVDAAFPGWLFTLAFADDGELARFEMTAIDIRAATRFPDIARAWRRTGRVPLSARLFHSVPLGKLTTEARALLRHLHTDVPSPDPKQVAVARRWAKRFSERPGMRGRDDRDYAELASKYVEMLAGGRAPVKRLAEHLHMAESRVANLLSEARRRGVLTVPPSGRAGGRLTGYGNRLLKEAEHATR